MLVPRNLVTYRLKSNILSATDELEKNSFVEIKVNEELLFSQKDKTVSNGFGN